MPHFLTRGQPAAVRTLARAVRTERPPQALLLTGPIGCGKTTLALDLAAGLLCLAPDPGDRPCRACPACRKVEHGNHPDVHRLVPEGEGGQVRVNAIRALEAELARVPLEGDWRIAIVEDAQRLNQDAQGALLKLLEEPLPGTVLILAAADTSFLLDTLVSRCARVRLGPVSGSALAELLVEAGVADPARAARLARVAAGRPRRALALARDPEVELEDAALSRQLVDLSIADRRTRLIRVRELLVQSGELDRREAAAIVEGDRVDEGSASDEGSAGLPETEAVGSEAPDGQSGGRGRASPAERRRAALRLLDAWRDVGRDLALVVSAGPDVARSLRRLDLLEDLEAAAQGLEPADVGGFLVRLDHLTSAIEAYANPELVLDALALAWPRPARVAQPAA